ncbi:MAG: dienelactone hydrolase family protein [Nitrospirae bacterium]|nr:dienelactone hydrolase family protein [Nitrospirota bacterium]
MASTTELQRKAIEYKEGDSLFIGYLVYPERIETNSPGVLLIPEWWGVNDFAKSMADRIAGEGFLVFVMDMYGQGKYAKTMEEAEKLSAPIKKDPLLMRKRALAGLKAFEKQSLVDSARIGVVGFSLGGRVAIELAKVAGGINGVVTVYGSLSPSLFTGLQGVKIPLLILHGYSDPLVDDDELPGILNMLDSSGIKWKMVIYGGAVHGFSNPAYGNDPASGTAYNKAVSEDAFREMIGFFKSVLK